jgi:hypothetical protein
MYMSLPYVYVPSPLPPFWPRWQQWPGDIGFRLYLYTELLKPLYRANLNRMLPDGRALGVAAYYYSCVLILAVCALFCLFFFVDGSALGWLGNPINDLGNHMGGAFAQLTRVGGGMGGGHAFGGGGQAPQKAQGSATSYSRRASSSTSTQKDENSALSASEWLF